MSTARFQPTHAVINNAPAVISVYADDAVLAPRLFSNSGAPASGTLAAGNGRYCGSRSGFVLSMTIVNGGSGYARGDVIFGTGGTASAQIQITVDDVDGIGKILEAHTSTVGVYSAYPTNPITVATGSGTGATFNLAFQPPDTYFDLTAKTLYVCTTGGTNSTSVWAAVSGAGASKQQFKWVSEAGDYMLCKTWDNTTLGTILIPILKDSKLRNSITSEVLFGATYAYTYASTGSPAYIVRSATLSGVTETQVVIPMFIAGDLIYADTCAQPIGCPTTVLSAAVVNGGTSGTYAVGNVLTVTGGTSTTAAQLTVSSVSGGIITGVNVTTNGIYTVQPANPVSITGGGGTGATFALTFSSQYLDDNRARAWAAQ